MAVFGYEERRPLDATSCDINTRILLLLLLLLVVATSLPLRLPIIHGFIPILVVAVVQIEYLLVERHVVVVLLRDHVVPVNNLLLGRRLLLPALLILKQFRFLALKLAPLLAQLLDVGVQLVDALCDHGCLLFQVRELAGVQLALLAEL